jgi:polyisoprenoid-binding protein YceI
MAREQESVKLMTPGRKAALLGLLLPLMSLASCNSLAATFLKPDVQASPASVPAGDYKLDPAHASLFFRINHLGYSTYVGRFERFEASLTGDPAAPESATVTAVVDMTSLNIANPEFAAELMGPDWFDAAAFPQASFKTYGLKITGENEADISGDLTLKGKTQAVILKAKLNGSGYDRLRGADVVGFSAVLPISRAAFGVDRFSGLLADEVEIQIEAEFVKAKPG